MLDTLVHSPLAEIGEAPWPPTVPCRAKRRVSAVSREDCGVSGRRNDRMCATPDCTHESSMFWRGVLYQFGLVVFVYAGGLGNGRAFFPLATIAKILAAQLLLAFLL
jgi:hypothetical protein